MTISKVVLALKINPKTIMLKVSLLNVTLDVECLVQAMDFG